MSDWSPRDCAVVLARGAAGALWSEIGKMLGRDGRHCKATFDRYATREQKAARASVDRVSKFSRPVGPFSEPIPAVIVIPWPAPGSVIFTDDPRAIRQCGLPRFYAPASENLRSFSGSSAAYAAGMG